MASEKDIENIIKLLDGKAESGVSRIRLEVSEETEQGAVNEIYHHGRCDVGSAWAKGNVKNFDCKDIPNIDE
ncbi:MAG: hypothetical protein ACLRZ9_04365 [Eubacterium sp.]